MIRKLLVYAVGAAVATFGVVLAIGYTLPQNHVATRDAVVHAPPAQVFDDIVQVTTHSQWRTGVTRVEILSTSPLRWREESRGDVITFEAAEIRAPHRLVSRIADPDLPFGGTWTFELAPEGAATRVRITENGEVYNPLFRFMSRFVFGHTAGIENYLAALQRRHAPR